MRTALFAAAIGPSAGAALAQEDWHPSRYGAEDELGAANLLTPGIALRAVS